MPPSELSLDCIRVSRTEDDPLYLLSNRCPFHRLELTRARVAIPLPPVQPSTRKPVQHKKFAFGNEYALVTWKNEIACHVIKRLKKDAAYMKTVNGGDVHKRFGKRRMQTLTKWWKGQVDQDKRNRRDETRGTGASGGKEASKPRFLTALRTEALNSHAGVNIRHVLTQSDLDGGAVDDGGTKRARIPGKSLDLGDEGGAGGKKKKDNKNEKNKSGGSIGGGTSNAGAPVDLTDEGSAGGGKRKEKKGDGKKGKGKGDAKKGKGKGKGKGKDRADDNGNGGSDAYAESSSEGEEDISDGDLSPPDGGESSESDGESNSEGDSDSEDSSRDGGGRSKSRRTSKAFNPQDAFKSLQKASRSAARQRGKQLERMTDVFAKALGGGGDQSGGGGASSGVAGRADDADMERRKLALEEKEAAHRQWQEAVASQKEGTGATSAVVAALAAKYFGLG